MMSSIKLRALLLMIVISCSHNCLAAEGDVLTTDEILVESVNNVCAAWTPVGICIWMTCTYVSCDFDYSVKVRHFIPDAVVSTYKDTGMNPWQEVQSYSQPTGDAEDGGSNTEGATVNSEQALRFKNGDAIGSPGVIEWDALADDSDYFCDPGTTPFFPYFLSTLDFNWRDPIIETPWTLINMFRSVDNGISTWGSVYPRHGFLHQGHDYKSGAVSAQRVADIVSREWQPHVYWPMVADSQQGYWPPGAVVEGDDTTHKWQQLNPKGNSTDCVVFADQGDSANPLDPFSDRVNQSTGYAWHLWRPYRCCAREGAVLIFHSGD